MDDLGSLLRQLRPLAPDRVDRWIAALRSDDPELRTLIERQARDSAARMLGGSNRALLLNLPRPGQVKGPINLGTMVFAGDRGPAGITPQELMQHVCIVGRSGAGKTNAVYHLCLQLSERRVPWVFFDMKRTARHLMPLLGRRVNIVTPGRSLRTLAFNPFIAPPGLEPAVYRGYVIDLLARAYSLGDGSISVLHKALEALTSNPAGSPTVQRILAHLENSSPKGRAAGWATSARRALESLALAGIGTDSGNGQQGAVRGLTSLSTIVELDGLNENARDFLVPLLCLWIYLERLGQPEREQLKVVLVLEEAHHFLGGTGKRARASVMDMILRQCRELGIGIVTVAQHPHLLSSSALGNSFTTMALNLKDVPDVNRAGGVLGLNDTQRAVLTALPVGHAVVKLQDRYREPFIVRIPQVAVRKGQVSDADLASANQARAVAQTSETISAHSGPNGGFGADPGAFGRNVVLDRPLDEHALRLLEDVILNPDDGVRARYLRLCVSGHRGNRLKARLLHDGWLEAETVAVGTSRKVLLRLSAAGRRMLGMERAEHGAGGLAHEYWKRWYAQRLGEDGYDVQLEAPRNGGRIDVLAVRDGRTLGVEIETGKSDMVANVRRCLHAGVGRVIVAVTDRTKLELIERAIARAGLLVPGRVTVVLAGDLHAHGRTGLGGDEDDGSQRRTDR